MLDLLSQEDEPKDFQEMMVSSALFERKQMRKTTEVEMVLGVIMLVLDVGGRSDDDGTGSEDDGAEDGGAKGKRNKSVTCTLIPPSALS